MPKPLSASVARPKPKPLGHPPPGARPKPRAGGSKRRVRAVFKRFDPAIQITCDKVVAFICKRNTGKTTAMFNFLAKIIGISLIILFSPTEPGARDWVGKIPDLFQYTKYDSDAINRVIKRQTKLANEIKVAFRDKYGRDITKAELKKRLPGVALVIEDCFADKTEVNKCVNLQWCFNNGRHLNILVLITLQSMMALGTTKRDNVDFAVLGRTTTKRVLDNIHQQWCGFIDKPAQFKKIFGTMTMDRGVMVIDTTALRNADSIFYYKADPTVQCALGHPNVWKFAEKNLRDGYELDELDMEIEEAREKTGKKAKPKAKRSASKASVQAQDEDVEEDDGGRSEGEDDGATDHDENIDYENYEMQ